MLNHFTLVHPALPRTIPLPLISVNWHSQTTLPTVVNRAEATTPPVMDMLKRVLVMVSSDQWQRHSIHRNALNLVLMPVAPRQLPRAPSFPSSPSYNTTLCDRDLPRLAAPRTNPPSERHSTPSPLPRHRHSTKTTHPDLPPEPRLQVTTTRGR